MKKNFRSKTIVFILALSLFIPSVSTSMIQTTDVTSYVYYLQQIKKLVTLYNEAKSFRKGNFSRLEEISDKLTGTYNMGKGLNSNLKDIQEGYAKTLQAVSFQTWMNTRIF